MSRRLLLASRSPRRNSLLAEAGYAFDIVPADYDEPAPERGVGAEDHALRLARGKAEAALEALPDELRDRVILAADTVVDLDGELLGQPASDEEAIAMLGRMSGSRHCVVTGVVLLHPASGRSVSGADRTHLQMLPMSDQQIRAYVASGESAGKAGSYAIQETGDEFVKVVEGSLSNVVGLPMELLARLLDELG